MSTHQIISNADRFTTYEQAHGIICRRENPSKWSIVLGDDFRYLIVTNREAAILEKGGFQIIY